jgi:hypothetical protein
MDFCKKQVATIAMPEEAEVGSAEEQPTEEYSGLRCAEGASRPVVAESVAAGRFRHMYQPFDQHSDIGAIP